MKKWAAKRDSDSKIVIIQCKINPQLFLDQMDDGPYTLLNEIDEIINPAPTRSFRDSWEDNGSGDVQVNMPAARAEKMATFRVERDKRLEKTDKDWVEKSSKSESLTTTETYKTELRDMMPDEQTAVDAETDDDTLATYGASWPTDPNA